MITLPDVAAEMPMLTRIAVGLVGGLLLVAGARWYHRAIGLSAFALGAVLATAAMVTLSEQLGVVMDPLVLVVAALVLGGMSAGVARLAHRWALAAVGAVAGAAAVASLASAVAAVPIWAALIGALVGALVFPWLWTQLLKVLTPAVGAVCIAWAVGMPDSPLLLGALWAFGAAVQLAGERASARKEEDA